jgi:hypothetical protein
MLAGCSIDAAVHGHGGMKIEILVMGEHIYYILYLIIHFKLRAESAKHAFDFFSYHQNLLATLHQSLLLKLILFDSSKTFFYICNE